jgi:hypothetical protein
MRDDAVCLVVVTRAVAAADADTAILADGYSSRT